MKITQVKCDQCGREFGRSLSRAKEAEANGSKQLCSKTCISAFHSSRELVACAFCSSELKVPSSVFSKSLSKRFFCNSSCSAKFNNRLRVRTQESKDKTSRSITASLELRGISSSASVCPVCGKSYRVSSAQARRGRGHHCSAECAAVARTGVPRYTRSGLSQALVDIYKKNNSITSKLVPRSLYAQAVSLFGSWKEAMSDSGLAVPSTNRRKGAIICNDGHTADSAEEAFLDNWLSSRSIQHEVNKYYPGTRLTCDFYLPQYDLWVEYLGLYESDSGYRSRFSEKCALAKEGAFTLVGVYTKDLREGASGVHRALAPFLLKEVELRSYTGRPQAPTIPTICAFCGARFDKLVRKHRMDLKLGKTLFFCCRSHQVKHQRKKMGLAASG